MVHQNPLQVSSSTGLLVGTASYLANFNLAELFPGCVCVIVDEADTAIQSDKNVWQVLSQYRRLYGILPFKGQARVPEAAAQQASAGTETETGTGMGGGGGAGSEACGRAVVHGRDAGRRVRKYDTHNEVQVVFAGATIPGNGSESVASTTDRTPPFYNANMWRTFIFTCSPGTGYT